MAKIKVRREGNLLWEDECQPLTTEQMADIKSQFHPSNTANVNITPYHIYSPTEHIVGEWQEMVDGVLKKKPLYERTIVDTTASTAGAKTHTTYDETIEFKDLRGALDYARGTTNKNFIELNWQAPGQTNNYIEFAVDDNGCIRSTVVSYYTNRYIYITYQYTKTTDTWQPV